MIEVALAGWIYFEACGFKTADIENYTYDVPKTTAAPNIKGFWVRKTSIVVVVDWKYMKGIRCASIYTVGALHPLHVIGKTEEVLKKLRE